MIYKKPPVILSLYDCWDVLKKGKKILLLSALVSGTCFFLYKVSKPLSYTAEATFKSNITLQSNLPKALEGLLDLKSDRYKTTEDPKLFFLTPPVLEKAVLALNLQGHISLPQRNGLLTRLWRNLKTEWVYARYRKKKRPSSAILNGNVIASDRYFFSDPCFPLKLTQVSYSGDLFAECSVYFQDEDHFIFKNSRGKKVSEGQLGEPVVWKQGSFTLTKMDSARLKGRHFTLTWIPLKQAVESLSKSLEVKRDKYNASLVRIHFTHPSRYLASEVVNAVMDGYTAYLQSEGEKKITSQLRYLENRQAEMEARLETTLQAHRQSIEECLKKGHFLSLEEEAVFLAASQQDCERRILELETEIRRLWPTLPVGGCAQLIEEWKNGQRALHLAAEYQKFPLKEILELLSTAQIEYEKSVLAKQRYRNTLQKLEDPTIELSSLAPSFEEATLQTLFSDIQTLSLKLLDEGGWTPKEKERMRKELETQKEFLRFQLGSLEKGAEVAEEALLSKMENLKETCLHTLFSEYVLVEEKLKRLSETSLKFAEKWLAEKKIDLNTSVHTSIVEAIAKMIEAKNIAFHTENLEAFPFVYAEPPVFPNPPKLRLFFLIGCFTGGFATLFFFLCQVAMKGPKASYENLKALGYRVIGKFPLFLPPLSQMNPSDVQLLSSLAIALSEHKMPSVVLCTSQTPMNFLSRLIELLSFKNEKVLWVNLDAVEEPGLFSSLVKQVPPKITSHHNYDFLSGGNVSFSQQILLSTPLFQQRLQEWRNHYDWIFLQVRFDSQNTLFSVLFSFVDQIIFQASSETISTLSSFPMHTLYLTTPTTTPITLPAIAPFLEDLNKNAFKGEKLHKSTLSTEKSKEEVENVITP